MFNSTFWTKYAFRVVHIVSLVGLSAEIINQKLTGQITKDYKIVCMIFGILVTISGFVNTYLLKPAEMGEHRKAWVGFHHLKLATALFLFTPVIKLFPISQQVKINLRFYWLVTALLLSPFFRFYREYFVAEEKAKQFKKIQEEQSP